MFTRYRRVLGMSGAWRFSASGVVARMPMSMVTLGLVLLIEAKTGSYGLAGAVSAAYMAASALTSPLLGRAMDKYGQSTILVPMIGLFVIGLVATVVAVDAGWPTPVPHMFAALAGVGYPPIGACVRSRWSYVAGHDKAALHVAYSLESVLDEAVFMTGPVLVTLLATLVSELAGVAAIVAFGVVGGAWFVAQRSTEPPPHPRIAASGPRPPLGWSWLLPVVVVAACLGSLFGSTEVATVAFTQQHGNQSLSGPLLAIWAFGSLLAGVATGAVTWKVGLVRRFVLGTVGMGIVMIPLTFVHHTYLLAVLLFVAGFSISPTMIAVAGLTESRSAPERLTEAMTWFTTGLTIGIAPGAAVAGRLIDQHGASAGYLVPLASGVVAAGIAVGSAPLIRRPGTPSLVRRVPVDVE